MLFYCKNRADFLRPEDYKIFLKRGEAEHWSSVLNGDAVLDDGLAQSLARGIFRWAKRKGAKFYCHKFFPFTGQSAQKLTSFGGKKELDKFGGVDLLKTELDASSFPSGGARSTDKARGYAVWDIFSQIYIDDAGGVKTLVLPSLFFSFDGTALDDKTPLLRSLSFLDRECTKLLRSLGQDVHHVQMTVGLEQEYFLIDRAFLRRPDLCLTGRTLFGAPPDKSQAKAHHYFSLPTEAELAFMSELDRQLQRVGIDAKIQHSEVAPRQFEVVPKFARADISATQNAILIEKLCEVARRHSFCALVHEKPFDGVNGSGKHNNWSLCTDGGVNLFDKRQVGADVFSILFSCVVAAVHSHYDLLRLAASSLANDLRLGGMEAPPSIISIFTGGSESGDLDLKLSGMPSFKKEGCDRNRTSPFAFTGNKFEFRMLGSNQSAAFCCTVIACALGQQFAWLNQKLSREENKLQKAKILAKQNFQKHRAIIFNGDSYGSEWKEESKKRGLKNYRNFCDCKNLLISKKSKRLFKFCGAMGEAELVSKHRALMEEYCSQAELEGQVACQMLTRDILPKLEKFYEKSIKNAKNLSFEPNFIKILKNNIVFLRKSRGKILQKIDESKQLPLEQKVTYVQKNILPLLTKVRACYDKIERLLPREFLPYPSFDDILNG